VLQTSASHLLAAQGPDLGVQKATNATGPDLGGSLGLIACFPQTLPAKKGDSMGWVNIKKVRKKARICSCCLNPTFFGYPIHTRIHS